MVFSIQFFESFTDRLAVARLLWKNAGIRLTCPEAYPVHRDIIEWNAQYSIDRIPDQAVGVDPITAKLMRWVMQSWERVHFFNRFLGGNHPSAHSARRDSCRVVRCASAASAEAVRFKPQRPCAGWYCAPAVMADRSPTGLHLQPEMTPVIFRWYAQDNRRISDQQGINTRASELSKTFERMTSKASTDHFSFSAGLGAPANPRLVQPERPVKN